MNSNVFYIGKALKLVFTKGYGFVDGVKTANSDSYASGIVNLASLDKVFMWNKFPSTIASIHFYEEVSTGSYSFLEDSSIVGNEIIEVPSSASHIAVSFSADNDYMPYSVDTDIAEDNYSDFVYAVTVVKEPLYTSLSIKQSKESGEQFFRKSLDGDIRLIGDDYYHVKNASIEDSMLIILETNKAINYLGQFFKTSCTLDYDALTATIETEPLDSYTALLNNYDNSYDVISLTPPTTSLGLTKRAVTQVYVAGSSTISNVIGSVYYESEVAEAVSDSDLLTDDYNFEFKAYVNEIYISDCPIEAANGIYTGTGTFLKNANGYAITANFSISGDTTIYLTTPSSGDPLNPGISILYYSRDHEGSWYASQFYYDDGSSMTFYENGNADVSFQTNYILLYRIFQRILCDVDTLDGSDTIDLLPNDFAYSGLNYNKCIGYSGGSLYASVLTTDEPTVYGKNDFGAYFTDKVVDDDTSMSGRKLYPISRNDWGNISLWYLKDTSYDTEIEVPSRKSYTISDAYLLSDIISKLLKEIGSPIIHSPTAAYSEFLYGSTNPITGDAFRLLIIPKSNILKGEYDSPAQTGSVSLESIMDLLSSLYKCYWFIEDNKLKIEHISYFMNGGSYTGSRTNLHKLSDYKDKFNGKDYAFMQSSVEYSTSELVSRYEFTAQEDATSFFTGLNIDIKSSYAASSNTENVSIEDFSCDIDLMLLTPDEFASSGFALAAASKLTDGSYKVPIISDTNIVGYDDDNYLQAYIQNYYASYLYAFNFYLQSMPGTKYRSNMYFTDPSVEGLSNFMTQDVSFYIEGTYAPENMLVETGVGTGYVDEISTDIATNLSKVSLLFSPE